MILGGIATAALCVAMALLMSRVGTAWVRAGVVVVAAYITSHIVFTLGVRFGGLSSEASSWSPVFINTWTAIGAVAGIAAVLVLTLITSGSRRAG